MLFLNTSWRKKYRLFNNVQGRPKLGRSRNLTPRKENDNAQIFHSIMIVFAYLAVLIAAPARAGNGLLDQAGFELKTSSDLVEVCNAPPDHPLV